MDPESWFQLRATIFIIGVVLAGLWIVYTSTQQD